MVKETDNKVRLNLACGKTRIEGYYGIDKVSGPEVDRVLDLEVFPWNIKTESVDEIYCSHYVQYTSNLSKFIGEVSRILKPGGIIKIIAPYYTSIRAIQDPNVKRFISAETFLYYNKNWRIQNKIDEGDYFGVDFDFNYGYEWTQDWSNRSEEARQFALKHYWNTVNDIHIILTKK